MAANPELSTVKPTVSRERLPYRMNEILLSLREMGRDTDANLEAVIAEIVASLEDDNQIDDDEAQAILIAAMRAWRANGQSLNVLNLLDESGTEAALREVERISLRKRKGARAKTHRHD